MAKASMQGSLVLLRGKEWKETFDPSLIGSRIRFYQALADRQNGRFKAFYAETIASLKALQKQLSEAKS